MDLLLSIITHSYIYALFTHVKSILIKFFDCTFFMYPLIFMKIQDKSEY